MKILKKYLPLIDTINFRLAQALLIYLPFHALLAVFFKYQIQIPFFPYLKDLIVILIFLTAILKNGLNKNSKTILIALYTILALSSYLWSNHSGLTPVIYGFKYDLAFFWVFLSFYLSKFTKPQQSTLLKSFFYSGTISLLGSLTIHFIGHDKLTNIGYRNDWSTSIAGESLAFCQRIEHQETCRLQGLFSGPNQLGTFILIHFTTALFLLKQKFQTSTFLILILNLITVYLTYSRSSILGIALIILLFTLLYFKNHRKKIILAFFTLTATAIATIFLSETIAEKFIRAGSNSGHLQSWIQGWQAFTQAPIIGQGIATAGPASSFFTPLIPENWFLQVAIQYGLIGLTLFLLILKSIPTTSYHKILLLGFLPPLLLLHPFESSAVSYSLFALLALDQIFTSNKKTKKLL